MLWFVLLLLLLFGVVVIRHQWKWFNETRLKSQQNQDEKAMPDNKDVEDIAQPYRWGKFQGWFFALGMPFLTTLSFVTAVTPEEYDRAIGFAIVCAPAIPMGIGILKKRRYGLILVYAILGLICVLIIIGFATGGANAARYAASGGPFWVACTLYYHKRRAEFT